MSYHSNATGQDDTPVAMQEMRVYINETDQWRGKPLYLAILEMCATRKGRAQRSCVGWQVTAAGDGGSTCRGWPTLYLTCRW